MENKPGSSKKWIRPLLIVLLAVVVVSGLVWARYYSQHQPQPLYSQAAEPPPHWPHEYLPATLVLLNSTSKPWPDHLSNLSAIWQKSGILYYAVKPGPEASNVCDLYPEVLHFCTWNADDGFLGFGAYVYNNASGHILTGGWALNNWYLYNGNYNYNTPAWRNYLLCMEMGFTAGLPIRYIPPDQKSTTCMNGIADDVMVQTQQEPDAVDLRSLKVAYVHNDDVSSSGVAYKVSLANDFFAKKSFGKLVQSLNNGQQQIYKMDLGDGYSMTTMVFSKGQDAKPAPKPRK